MHQRSPPPLNWCGHASRSVIGRRLQENKLNWSSFVGLWSDLNRMRWWTFFAACINFTDSVVFHLAFSCTDSHSEWMHLTDIRMPDVCSNRLQRIKAALALSQLDSYITLLHIQKQTDCVIINCNYIPTNQPKYYGDKRKIHIRGNTTFSTCDVCACEEQLITASHVRLRFHVVNI